jgi:short-subunit dehydrogenase involved in D-alanine esterification of teichoic acids
MDKNSKKTLVQLANEVKTLNLKELNVLVGKIGIQLMTDYEQKEIIKEVAQEKFEEDHGAKIISWSDYAEKFSANTKTNFHFEQMSKDRLAR